MGRELIGSALSALLLLGACSTSSSLMSDAGGEAKDASTSKSCFDFTSAAIGLVLKTVEETAHCVADADCMEVVVPPNCWASCQTGALIGTAATLPAVEQRAEEIEAICRAFRTAGCKVVEPGCAPPVRDKRLVCTQGKCISVPIVP